MKQRAVGQFAEHIPDHALGADGIARVGFDAGVDHGHDLEILRVQFCTSPAGSGKVSGFQVKQRKPSM